jgi:hypothetical protein
VPGRRFVFHIGQVRVGVGRLYFARGDATRQLMHANPPGNHRQIGGQAGLAPELSQHGVVAGDDLEQDLGSQIFCVLGTQWGAAEVRGMVHDMVDQTEKPIDEIVPGAGLVRQTPPQQVAIQLS